MLLLFDVGREMDGIIWTSLKIKSLLSLGSTFLGLAYWVFYDHLLFFALQSSVPVRSEVKFVQV